MFWLINYTWNKRKCADLSISGTITLSFVMYLLFQLTYVPLFTGNAAVIKPSEVCVHTSKVMEELLPLYIDKVRHHKSDFHLIKATSFHEGYYRLTNLRFFQVEQPTTGFGTIL